MVKRFLSRDTALTLAVLLAAAVALLVITFSVGSGTLGLERLGIAVLAAIVGTAAILLHPSWTYRCLAFVLGAAPVATVPGLGTPVVLVLALAVWMAVLTHPVQNTRISALESSVGVLVIASSASLVMTAGAVRDITEFVKWLIATSMVFALSRLSRPQLRAFGRTFVFGAATGAAVSLGFLFFDGSDTMINKLAVIGITSIGDTGGWPRLTGTYVEPNSAGIFLLIALAIAVALLRGRQRFLIAAVILTALICTLSRSAMVSVIVAVLFLLIFQPMPARVRLLISATLLTGCAAVVSVPVVYARFAGSFTDRGSTDRAASLAEYTSRMSGSWWFGKGWGLAEFITDSAAWQSNHVANSPLLSVYRGGVFVGLAFVLVLVVGTVVAYRNVFRSPWESGLIGAQFVGFALVGLQLDFPVVTQVPVAMAWSVLIVFLIANPVEPHGAQAHLSDHTSGLHRKGAHV